MQIRCNYYLGRRCLERRRHIVVRALIFGLCAIFTYSPLYTQPAHAQTPPLTAEPEPGHPSQLPTSPDDSVKALNSDSTRLVDRLKASPFGGNVETTLFDVYFGDKFKGAVLADYTDQWLLISDPDAILEQVQDLKQGDKLLPLLTGKIEKRKEIAGIGIVHYDLNAFRIVLDINEQFLPVSTLNVGKLSPDPDAGFTLQQKIGVTAAGTVDNNLNSAINHHSVASLGQYFAVIDGAVVSNQPYEITEAKAGGIFGDYRASTGLLQTTGNTFAPSLQFTGVSAETAQELFLDQDLIRGSRFEVFIPSRSRVEFYRDGRLISVQSLDFGLREIDTSAFPQGSYDVDVVITDSFGTVSRERKFFTKSGYLASQNQPIFFFQGGNIRDNLNMLNTLIYQGGFRWRAADAFDLGGSVYGSEHLTIGSVETNALYRNVRFSGNYVMSSKNDAGARASIGSSILGAHFDLSSTKTLRGGTKEAAIPEPDPNDPFAPIFNLRNRRQELVFQDRSSQYATLYRSFGPVDVRFAGERNSGSGTPKRNRHGPTVEWKILDRPESNLRFQGSRFETDIGRLSSVGLLYTRRVAKNWTLSGQIAERHQETSKETMFLLALTYDGKTYGNTGTRAAYRNEIQSRRPNEGDRVLSVANQLDVDHTGDYLQSIGFVRDTRTKSDQNTAIGVSAIGSFLMSADGAISVAHPVSQEAVFVAEVPSSTTSSDFEVLLNDQVAANVKAGGKAVVGVTPYKKYTIKIRPVQGADLVDYDSKETTTTFFPGNVVKRIFKVEKVFIVLGRVVDSAGNPLVKQRIKGPKEYTITDEDGTFQAEISGQETLRIQNKQNDCLIDLAIPVKPEYLIQVGDVRCVASNDPPHKGQ